MAGGLSFSTTDLVARIFRKRQTHVSESVMRDLGHQPRHGRVRLHGFEGWVDLDPPNPSDDIDDLSRRHWRITKRRRTD